MRKQRLLRIGSSSAVIVLAAAAMVQAQHEFVTMGHAPAPAPVSDSKSSVKDPGVRTGGVTAGGPIANLTADELLFFQNGLIRFAEVDSVSGQAPGEQGGGLGPGYNSNSCFSCHAQPSIGGTSPSTAAYPNIGPNPQIQAASDYGATNTIPDFITADGPVRETRFPMVVNPNGSISSTPDGGVHDVFTIAGRQDAPNCVMPQPNYEAMEREKNLVFRIPTPTFGTGLIENIPDSDIVANMQANSQLKSMLRISGHPNVSGNDGTITRFGWKAQNKSLEIFAGEAYNVEMGVTNELFPNERSAPASCLYNSTPEDATNFTGIGATIPSDTVMFAAFMRFLAAPTPSSTGIPGNPSAASLADGQKMFSAVHCDMCHTPQMRTGSTSRISPALVNQTVPLYSDLLVHDMGSGLADNVSQGNAAGNEFRTAPLWGVGQRIFFLHDGRSTPANGGLMNAIQAHASSGSEANQVISLFNQLPAQQQQDLLNFLRSL